MLEIILWLAVCGLLWLAFLFLYGLAGSVLERIDRKLNPEANTEPIRRSTVGGAVYLRQGGKILDVGRGIVLDLQEGIIGEVNQDILTWEGKRRIMAATPHISMRVVQEALTSNRAAPLPMPKLITAVKEEAEVIEL